MPSERISRCFFATYSTEEILKLSVKEVRNPNTFDSLLHATQGGLYDSAFGPNERDDVCKTCGLGPRQCPGHFGHISLPLPVYHPLFFRLLVKLLKGSCFKCHRLVIRKSRLLLLRRQLELIDQRRLTDALDLGDVYTAILSEKSQTAASKASIEIEVAKAIDEAYLTPVENGTEKSGGSKNVTKLRTSLVKTFLELVSQGKKVKNCPNCKAPVQDIRAEFNSRLYLKPVTKALLKQALLDKEFKKARENRENLEEDNGAIEVENDDREENDVAALLKQTYLTPVDVREHVHKVWDSDADLMNSVFGSVSSESGNRISSPDMFFVNVVPVAPSRFRPLSTLGDKRFENSQTVNLNKILVDCIFINHYLGQLQRKDSDNADSTQKKEIPMIRKKGGGVISVPGENDKEKLQNSWLQLQNHVNCFMDSDLDKLSMEKLPGIRQLLEKKEGLFRKHMMGKRVNFAARSVISPDPYVDTDEIGIPEVFAKKLTYPEPVTPCNAENLMKAIVNGPNKHPGATLVEYEDGKLVALNPSNIKQRKAIARRLLSPQLESEVTFGCKRVHRHLVNGDVLLLNRQPTLHRPSIMAHKARVLRNEKTIRLHYANCKAYNADFDGDEMNAHFPQNELARAESYGLVSTNYQYLSPKDGKPLSGLIQDHVVSGVQMTTRDVFFSREEYQQLVYNALIDKSGKISTLPPCIQKPSLLWSGKQVVSTILINVIPEGMELLNLKSKGKVSDKNWPKITKDSPLSAFSMENNYLNETEVLIRDGQLLTGILDKSQYGATAFGLVHSCFELYGGQVSGKLLSVLARLFSSYLRLRGFSLGVEDILVKPKAEAKREKYMKLGRECGDEAAVAGLGLDSDVSRKEIQEKLMEAHHTQKGMGLQLLDQAMKKKTDSFQNKINTSVIPTGLLKPFPENALQLMIASGAKGSAVNSMQISSLLGQIELEGRRPPLMLSGRSLPSFLPYDTCPRAGGFVDGRFLTGIRPQEYFFHCMAGREGLVDTAVKTSRSGYLQRCLIKHLEGLVVQYDLTVRDSDGSVVQFLYGEDGIDVCKSQFLQEARFNFIADNYEEYRDQMHVDESIEKLDDIVAPRNQRKVQRWKRKFDIPFSSKYNHKHPSAFTQFVLENQEKLMADKSVSAPESKQEIVKMWHNTSLQDKESFGHKCRPCPDPVLCIVPPDRNVGSVSEKYGDSIDSFISNNKDYIFRTKSESERMTSRGFHALLLLKYLRSLASPGDAVGLLAGQSIGEPSTQMTLNTFHFAGRGEMNVTLGIPRLREILMTASASIRTPTMDVLVNEGEENRNKASHLQKGLNRVCMSQILQKIDASESLAFECDQSGRSTRCRRYGIQMQFLPQKMYKEEYNIKPEDILRYVEMIFIKRIIVAILKVFKIRQKENLVRTQDDSGPKATPGQGRSTDLGDESEGEVSDAEDEVDGDAADTKFRSRQTQFASYEEPEEEELLPEPDAEEEGEEEDRVDNAEEDSLMDMGENLPEVVMDVSQEKRGRVNAVISSDTRIISYDYDEEKERCCEFTLEFPVTGSKVMLIPLIEQTAGKAVISEAKGITKCILAASQHPKEEGRFRLRTEGVNIEELWHYPEILNLNSLYTNDIHAVAERYGIEAARRVIIKEIHDVFKVYGIQIDPRHLSLVGDYMTFEGAYRPFNRIGIESNPSPFQKMSFETTTHFLRSATAHGDMDSLGSPSSCLVVGKSIRVGTGLFQLQQPLC